MPALIAGLPGLVPAGAALPSPAPVAGAIAGGPTAGAVVAAFATVIDVAATAGVPLGGHRAVCLAGDATLHLASSDDPGCTLVLGITTGAAQASAQVAVRRLGEIDDPSFAFAIGPVWLGLAGSLTQARPTSGVLLQVGFAVGPTRLLVHPRTATILAP